MAFDFSQIKSWTIPEGEVQSVSIGGVVVWSASTLPTDVLATPTISLDESLLTMSTTDTRTEEFVVIVKGEEKATVSAIEYTSGMAYKLVENEDGKMSYTCVGIGNATDSVIHIPSYTSEDEGGDDNIPVTAIGYEAFREAAITGIVIPDTVTIIDRAAVYNSPTLQKVVVQGIAEIAERVFASNNNLHTVELNDSIKIIGSGAFNGCSNLKKITLPNSLTSLAYEVFAGSGLTEIVIPNSVTMIGASAFHSCKSLESAIIGSGVTEIDVAAFYNCTNLKNIAFNGDITQWNAIKINSSLWHYGVPAKYVQCVDGNRVAL